MSPGTEPGDGSAARPPVLLVPGWSDRARALKRLRAFLLAEGWPVVHVLDFADRFGGFQQSAGRHGGE